ncbi:hypothetical protein LXM50_17255 [Microbacterium sp. Au-Mic1]|uniref:hypothetical protein n=1 Tax=Microbacterium sp. Au-Mic1 TaxID=2906457 RepID=UPI001E3A6B66|nr:hypothetical protein [Microbacterium sp. Au-Mic1]MCE4027727.1 hypothetical protein [Microbacterium sp. Au-Mic1]
MNEIDDEGLPPRVHRARPEASDDPYARPGEDPYGTRATTPGRDEHADDPGTGRRRDE